MPSAVKQMSCCWRRTKIDGCCRFSFFMRRV